MKVITASYSAVFNRGNYENEKVGFTADLEDGDSPEAAIEVLRKKAAQAAGPSANEMLSQRYDLERQLRSLTAKVAEAEKVYSITVEFMTAQGIKTDMPPFPVLKALSEPKPEFERIEVRELDDADEDFDKPF